MSSVGRSVGPSIGRWFVRSFGPTAGRSSVGRSADRSVGSSVGVQRTGRQRLPRRTIGAVPKTVFQAVTTCSFMYCKTYFVKEYFSSRRRKTASILVYIL